MEPWVPKKPAKVLMYHRYISVGKGLRTAKSSCCARLPLVYNRVAFLNFAELFHKKQYEFGPVIGCSPYIYGYYRH